jgi:hypothetical protein
VIRKYAMANYVIDGDCKVMRFGGRGFELPGWRHGGGQSNKGRLGGSVSLAKSRLDGDRQPKKSYDKLRYPEVKSRCCPSSRSLLLPRKRQNTTLFILGAYIGHPEDNPPWLFPTAWTATCTPPSLSTTIASHQHHRAIG